MEQGFGGYHPAVNFIFFAGAVLFGMFFVHPAFLLLSVGLSCTSYFLFKGRRGVRLLLGMLVLFAAVSLLNPVFNPYGETVLFTWLWGRPFTLEALLYGLATGGMFLTVILWFACYNEIMTSDKFIYLFGKFVPALSLVLCMVLRFVPHFREKAQTIGGARRCIGKSAENGTKRERLESGMAVLSVLTSWSLEGAAVTADSMKSRGYGSGPRTNFSIYRLSRRDGVVLTLLAVCAAGLAACMLRGGTEAVFLPGIFWAQGPATALGSVFYGIFLAVPAAIQIGEGITWRILRSRI